MDAITVSPKYQIVIPLRIRKALGLRPGQRLQAYEQDGVIQLVPVLPMEQARGMFGPMDTAIEREPDREF